MGSSQAPPAPTRNLARKCISSAFLATLVLLLGACGGESRAVSSAEREWVAHRIDAVVQLYGITTEGEAALRQLDVRWMSDQPGFFGSFGFKSWTGVGEAKPHGVMHELSHAYFGLFPVTGFPDLGWEAPRGRGDAPAMERYRRDVLEFMKQPPDHFEMLRSRLRSFGNLSSTNPEPLLHSIEADAVHTTAGDLDLVPPILRKYWDRFLSPGPFNNWYIAFRWYRGLPPDQKPNADKFLGFEHFDLRDYESLDGEEGMNLEGKVQELLNLEERQRLRDFVAQFDRLVGAPEYRGNFQFWRGYLRDKIGLHERHSGFVTGLDLPRAREAAAALDFLVALGKRDLDQRAEMVIGELDSQPFLVHFLPTLEDRTLTSLFTSDTELPEGTTLKGTAEFVDSLERFTPQINRVLDAARTGTTSGVQELTAYLEKVDFEKAEELRLFFELFLGAGEETAKAVVAGLDDSTLRRLLAPVPVNLRSLLEPPRFLEFLDITAAASQEELARGIVEMIEHTSGNFRIDEPFWDEMYRVIAARVTRAPLETLGAVGESPFPMERFMKLNPQTSVEMLASDLDATVDLVTASDTVNFPPARFVYRLIQADPRFAARLVARLDQRGETELVTESLAHFAYDADRLREVPTLPISLEGDGLFLAGLLNKLGEQRLEERLGDAVALYRKRAEDSEVDGDFLKAYERTLREAVSLLEDGAARGTLQEMIVRLFP